MTMFNELSPDPQSGDSSIVREVASTQTRRKAPASRSMLTDVVEQLAAFRGEMKAEFKKMALAPYGSEKLSPGQQAARLESMSLAEKLARAALEGKSFLGGKATPTNGQGPRES